MGQGEPIDKGGASGPPPPGGSGAGSSREARRRLEFVSADVDRLRGSRIRITVTLADRGTKYRGESEGVGDRQVELRLAARAALDAIGEALGLPGFFELVGLKQIHAFDADVVLVAVRTGDAPGRRLLGAVPVARDPGRTAAVATLDAVNRVAGPELAEG